MTTRTKTAAITLGVLFLTSCGGVSNSKQTQTPPSLQNVAVSVSSASMEIGDTRQLTASGHYSDGTSEDVSSAAAWMSSNPAVAQVSNSGLVTAIASGNTSVTASLGGLSASASITVTPALKSIVILPGLSSVSVGDHITLTATANYSDSSTKDVTAQVKWSSSNSSVATVSSSGALSVMAAGDAVISAVLGSITGSTPLHASAPKVVVSIAVTAGPDVITVGKTSQFDAVATYDDASKADVTQTAQWSSSAPAVATVSASGVATGISAGVADIQATMGSVSGHAALTVNPLLVSIDIAPANPAIELNTSQALTANGHYSDGSQRDLTAVVAWSSSNVSVATILPSGVVTAVAPGTSSISATSGEIVGSTNLTVRSAHLTSIVVDQDGMTIPLGVPQQLTATGVFSDGSTSSLVALSWTSSDSTILSIDANGLASPLVIGSVTVTATSQSVTGTGTLNVGQAILSSVALAPEDPSLPLGLTQQFSLVGTFSDRTTQNLTSGVVWESSDPSIAQIDNNGLANSLSVGTSVIKATVGGFSASSSLTVTSPTVVQIVVKPDQVSLPAGSTQQFTATATYTDSSMHDLTNAVWSSSDGSIASVSNSGLATALQPGQSNITASSGGVNGSAVMQVTSAVLTGLSISPPDMTAPQGNNIQFAAAGRYSDGTTKDLTEVALWSSSAPQTVGINAQGVAVAHQVGTATLTAEFGGFSATVLVNVVLSGTATSTAATPVISPYSGVFTSTQTVTITCSTPGTWLYYTTDGSNPTTASQVYTGPFTVTTTTTVKAMAAGGSYNASPVAFAIFTLAASAPVISPISGVYAGPQTVTITESTPGTSIYYTTDGSTPTTASQVYSGSFPVTTTTTVRAIAAGGGYSSSAESFAIFTIAAAAPVISPTSGVYAGPQTVTITESTPGTSIYYTTDGSTPTTSSLVYSGPFPVTKTTTIRAIAAGGGYSSSAESVAILTMAAAAPVISPTSGVYTGPQTVTITAGTPGTSIYYTTDGSTPTTASQVYSGPFTVTTTTTIRAIAAGGGYSSSAETFAVITVSD
jgi:uncharacterized protein YjdB